MDSEKINELAESIAAQAIAELESKRKSLTDNDFSSVFKMALNDDKDQAVLNSVIKKVVQTALQNSSVFFSFIITMVIYGKK